MFVEQKKSYKGKKVWLLNENVTATDGKEYTIVRCIDSKKANDNCSHIVVKDSEGNEKEVIEYNVVLCPNNKEKDIATRIYNYLSDNWAYPSDVYISDGMVMVHIDWGDWKHQHIWATYLMGYLGYDEAYESVTEEDGSDCYSALHAFTKKV